MTGGWQEPPRYVLPMPPAEPKRPHHPVVRFLGKLAILYVVINAFCFLMEGSMRLKYGVGSVTEIERRVSDRRLRAKELVARQKKIDAMTQDPIYDAYLVVILIGTPIGVIFTLIHDIRFINSLMRNVWAPVRWLVLGFALMLGNGVLLMIGPFVAAEHFYDRTSPAELIRSLNR